jgi:hypothetical protein
VVSLGAFLTGTQLRGALYGLGGIAAFLLIQRNLRADTTLLQSVDTNASPELGLNRQK